MRGFKRDHPATNVAYGSGRFRDKTKRSFLSQPKDSDHGCVAHELLRGVDRSARREEVFWRDKGICFYCEVETTLSDGGEMCHKNHKAGKKCDCHANVHWGHHDCHMKADHDEARLPRLKSIPGIQGGGK